MWDNQEKSGTIGGGWQYDEPNLTYDAMLDPDTGNPVYYDGFGIDTSWTNITKTISLLLALFI
jgi:hypothetical protein